MRSTFLDTGSFLDLSTLNKTGEVLEGAVIGGFRLLGKSTAGQLPHPEMIGDALTAYPFSRARIISAVASGQVLFFVAFHNHTSIDLDCLGLRVMRTWFCFLGSCVVRSCPLPS